MALLVIAVGFMSDLLYFGYLSMVMMLPLFKEHHDRILHQFMPHYLQMTYREFNHEETKVRLPDSVGSTRL